MGREKAEERGKIKRKRNPKLKCTTNSSWGLGRGACGNMRGATIILH
jgi:hypothetical protein